MKKLLLLIIIFNLVACVKNNTTEIGNKTKSLAEMTKLVPVEQLKVDYKKIEDKLYSEAKKTNADNIDFSDITSSLEKEYNNCNNEILKPVIGYELAKNYYLNFRNSNDSLFFQKSENLFNKFLSFRSGTLASDYLKLDPDKTECLLKKWSEFNTVEKDSILFYALLRGFEHGLPYVLKNP